MAIASGRRFNVLDGMILVAATAIGLALVRLAVDQIPKGVSTPTLGIWLSYGIMRIVTVYAVPILLAWTVVFVFLRMIPPRPSPSRLARGPGTVACAAAALGFSIHVARDLAEAYGFPSPFWRGHRFETFLWSVELGVALTIGGAWLTLILSGRWRPISDWVDRFGRLIGLSWIVATLTRSASLLLFGVLSE